MNIVAATSAYEAWLGEHLPLDPLQLDMKHRRMAGDPFTFLRGTYYRWAQLFGALCPGLAGAPMVVAVGDVHMENFGTWRDAEGRLVWGVNDFDEAYPLPYTNDLVRLAASALLARRQGFLYLNGRRICRAILRGYRRGLQRGGTPFVLGERRPWLAHVVDTSVRGHMEFWQKLHALPDVRGALPVEVLETFGALLPRRGMAYQVKHRASGVGSLGRRRIVALIDWNGETIAREAKEMAPSAAAWAAGHTGSETYSAWIHAHAVRIRDPFLRPEQGWVVRRLAPDCRSLTLDRLPLIAVQRRLLRAMGGDLANVHLGSAGHIPAVRDDLRHRDEDWLLHAARLMARACFDEWKAWRRALLS